MKSKFKSLSTQVGGKHYDIPIQPAEYNQRNHIGWCEGNVVKYITRHGKKNGVEDIFKALHYCQMILEIEYGVVVEIRYPKIKVKK